MSKYRVLLVDDHPLMRQALAMVLEDEADFEIVAEANNGLDAIEKANDLLPDLIIMDLLMPMMNGSTAIQKILEKSPQTKILALSSTGDNARILEAIQAGAGGFISKEAQPEELLAAIRTVAQGSFFINSQLNQKLLRTLPFVDNSATPITAATHSDGLTEREQEILKMMADGLSNRLIAERLVLSEATVRSHSYHIINKLGVQDRNQAVIYALKKFS
jgi:DNA-binding NarL/FixJ family response regulator